MKFVGTFTGVGLSKNGRPEARFELRSDSAVNAVSGITQTEYVVDVRKPRKQRSLNQNALMWELIGQIDIHENGKRTAEDDERIYVNILKKAGVRFYTLVITKDAVERFKEITGEGFRAFEIVREYHNWFEGDMVLMHCFVGSSQLDTKEMSGVIDAVLDYAKHVGIDTDYWELQLKGLDA